MKQALLVGIGGLLGSVARFKIGGLILHHSGAMRFPLSTFAVNVMGCFVIGALAGLAEHRDMFSPDLRLVLFPGMLGGFTTFSAFGYETIFLIRRGEIGVAFAYTILSVAVGFLAVWLGLKLCSR
jgi:CrcB protein